MNIVSNHTLYSKSTKLLIIQEMMPKRTATGLNKFIYVLRNSFDKSVPLESEVASKVRNNSTIYSTIKANLMDL